MRCHLAQVLASDRVSRCRRHHNIVSAVTASDQHMETSESGRLSHPTRGRRRKVKGPPAVLPQLPASAMQHRLGTSSGEPEEESAIGQQPKRQRSTSTTPISDSGRARAPFELDRLMGVGSVRTPCRGDSDSERTNSEEAAAEDLARFIARLEKAIAIASANAAGYRANVFVHLELTLQRR